MGASGAERPPPRPSVLALAATLAHHPMQTAVALAGTNAVAVLWWAQKLAQRRFNSVFLPCRRPPGSEPHEGIEAVRGYPVYCKANVAAVCRWRRTHDELGTTCRAKLVSCSDPKRALPFASFTAAEGALPNAQVTFVDTAPRMGPEVVTQLCPLDRQHTRRDQRTPSRRQGLAAPRIHPP